MNVKRKNKTTNPNKVPYCIAGFGGVQAAALTSLFRPRGQERYSEIRSATCTKPLKELKVLVTLKRY